jgi:DNA invertase Pin-like site-specific DNA recombinase
LERPALQQLLAAVREHRVDVIVIYKIDRLTRSLMDFAKLAELFDKEGISFVSVTQQFNTTTSMGRLMLNVLLSFAQFEREITGERIRDKIAASKKKGMWMGGTPPIGYRVENRTLVVEPEDAKTVRAIFRLYLEVGNVRALANALDERGTRTKERTHPEGTTTGGLRFQRGHLYGLLSNPIYIGRIGHKGQSYPGTHPPIVNHETWEAVQGQLAQNTQGPRKRPRTGAKATSLLAGLLYADNGNRFTPSHANKAGRRYRYYVEQLPEDSSTTQRKARRIPAQEIEEAVRTAVLGFLDSRHQVLNALGHLSAADTKQALLGAKELRQPLTNDGASAWAEQVQPMLAKVVLGEERLRVVVDHKKLRAALGRSGPQAELSEMPTVFNIDAAARVSFRGTRMKLLVGGDHGGGTASYDRSLIKTIARAHDWFECLRSGKVDSIETIAKSESLTGSYVTRVLRLAFLSPDMVERILHGTQLHELSADHLTLHAHIPPRWEEQDFRAIRHR